MLWMGLGTVACLGYPFLPPGGGRAVAAWLFGLVALLVMVAGVRRNRPTDVRPWYVFIAGQVLWVLGDAAYAIDETVRGFHPYPSWSDAFYLSAYPPLIAGLYGLARGRRRREWSGLVDTAIIAAGLGLIYWIFVIGPILGDTASPLVGRLVTIGYPTASVLMIAVVARLVTRAGRPTVSGWLLIIGSVLTLAANVVYTLMPAVLMVAGDFVYTGFLFAYVYWAGAALHPSVSARPRATGREQFGRGRLAILTCSTLVVPAVLFLQGAHVGRPVSWLAIGVGAVVLFVLVLIRMAGFVAQVQAQAGQLEILAMRDELTGLANRRRFEQRVREALETGSPQVAMLDLTGFKAVNDRFGHAVGDELLAAVGARLGSGLRPGDLAARMGGDEFAVLVADATAAEGDTMAARLGAALRVPIETGEHELLIGAGIGVAGADGTDDAVELLRRADVAMYAAKADGDKLRRYSADLDDEAGEEARLGAAVRIALDTGQFRLVYQPIVSLPDGRIVSVEALIRWDHPDRGFVSPAEFIPVAEQNGLIVELGAWILRTACAQAVVWRNTLGDAAPERVSVNVSARQLAEPGFTELVSSVLAWTGLGAQNLILEVTETAVFGGGQAVQAVKDLHELGVRIALDDFGTGHSSLGLLQTVPVDVLKVDKSFVDNITLAGREAVIATALIQVSHGLGLMAVAEGVETAEQAAELHRLGYRLAQGYHFGRPVAEPDFLGEPTAVAVV
ncbi:putative signaling protein [Actinoplanes friuliensis DSM 7358]|uniref:Putative signaling protein n=1 Tax=Actinoplanes friuliensis DSM 7358 TaxID=1246995 RepID=U5W1V3_9ACTN|nr:putative signaling protein [Actinoplanes friuliensis DSM 7358]